MSALQNAYRIVHLDLKGAPPKIEYFQQLFPMLKKFGATGLLLEYEDMFPYSGQLEEIASPFAYSKDNIAQILQLAKENKLIVIPLVQSFGHFEFVLKHEKFKSLCEITGYPSALCPSNPDSLTAVSMMIDQMMELHPAVQYFHIGADEVYHLGACERCKKKMAAENLTIAQLFFVHIRAVCMYVKVKYPALTILMWDDMLRFLELPVLVGVSMMAENFTIAQLFFVHIRAVCMYVKVKYPALTILMWDDMLRFLELPVLVESGLGSLVEVMIWHYLPSFLLPPDLWDRLSKVFPNIWAASAFKGATGACVYATNIMYHIDNHLTWLSVLEREKSKFQNIRGIVVTGWQRYDHYAILCELLPQALPSLAICLSVINRGNFSGDCHMEVSKQLKFPGLLPLNPFEGKDIPLCDFPGSDIYTATLEMVRLESAFEDFMHSEGRTTWMNEYHMRRNFTNPMHIEALLAQALKILNGLKQLHSRFEKSLKKIYFANTVEEWCCVYIKHKIDKLADIVEMARNQQGNGGIVGKVREMQT